MRWLYNDEVMDRYQNPMYYGKPEKFDIKMEEPSSSCGDRVVLYMNINEGKIEEMKWEGEGCIISMVSADLFCEKAKGKEIEELAKVDDLAFIDEFPIKVTSGRYNCVLLPLKGLKRARKEK